MLKSIRVLPCHQGKVWSVAWHPSGSVLASCGDDKTVSIFNTNSSSRNTNLDDGDPLEITEATGWKLWKRIGENHERTIRDVAWSLCGKFIAVASFDAAISIWEKSNKSGDFECVTTVEGHENEVKSVAWSPSGQYFASCGRDKNVMVWSMSSDGDYEIECESVLSTHTQDVKRVIWHPTEDLLVSCSYDDTIRIFRNDPNDGDWTCSATLEGHESTVWAVDFDASGNRLVSVSDDRTLKIWKRTTVTSSPEEVKFTCVSTIGGYHKRAIYDVSWNKSSGLIATACGDDHIRIFKETPSTNPTEENLFELVTSVKAHQGDVNKVTWNPKVEGILASCGDDGAVKLWKFEDLL